MSRLRSDRLAALLLAVAAVAGLVVANSPVGAAVIAVRDVHPISLFPALDLSIGHWVTDGLLAIFFLLAAMELRHELTHGELDSPRKALVPAVAAIGGVIAPAAYFLLIVQQGDLTRGWPIPTATDIAFALGVLALAGRGLPPRIRAMLLALAVIDDLIAIAIIAFFFTEELSPAPLLAAIPVVLLVGWLSYRMRKGSEMRPLVLAAMIALALVAWVLVALSGVHPTIAGVALGLIAAPRAADLIRHAVEPWTNSIVLPVFAFTASLVAIPTVGLGGLSPVFWAIVVALPVGKIAGIGIGSAIGLRFIPVAERKAALPLGDVLVVASLGGIGFTVSLLMNELAFEGNREIAAEGTLGVLVGSAIAIVVGGALAANRARQYRVRATTPPPAT
jgi:NhaA family Na+:H+ antiporter